MESFLILAQAPGGGASPLVNLGFIGLLVAIMYFVMIRPQQKQMKSHRELLAGLKKGDEVVTQGGLVGKIHQVSDQTVTLEVASGVRIRVLKRSVYAKGAVADDAAPASVKPEDKKEEK
ncbi:preprotein translocase subunit YajC [Stigmatella sp. ncwal1]|uniref:Sec translocon accessory complex subunit YajC n=2 Tax=Stigmatella TaxID=40 RepID=A0A7U3MY77_STIAU|nr:preprotein translocase subunit YajC [Stigmatella ashevillena]MDC0708919.1 preprotein translocase subunit YajC [Stigmatella ashevillena]QKW94340.1 preprotein translocase YajC subunit [Stigmatella aurantiaca]